MATSTHFSKFDHVNEQNLLENIIIESIKIYGHDVHYLPRVNNNIDILLGEDPTASFNDAYPIEVYVKTIDGFEGEGSFISKFGLEIRDQVTFTMSKSRWTDLNLSTRPQEGDLIWFPLTKKLFEIQFVEHEAVFYQTGRLNVFDLQCELFQYSDESIDTGLVNIDAIEADNAFIQTFPITYNNLGMLTLEDGYHMIAEDTDATAVDGRGNMFIQDTVPLFMANETITGQLSLTSGKITTANLTHINVTNITNTFTIGEEVIGSTSTARADLGTKVQEDLDVSQDSQADNVNIENIADGIIDFTEGNPFSESI
jgi:hypothetical protein